MNILCVNIPKSFFEFNKLFQSVAGCKSVTPDFFLFTFLPQTFEIKYSVFLGSSKNNS